MKDGQEAEDIAIPHYGYKSHIAIDRRYRFVRACAVTHASPDRTRQHHPLAYNMKRFIFLQRKQATG